MCHACQLTTPTLLCTQYVVAWYSYANVMLVEPSKINATFWVAVSHTNNPLGDWTVKALDINPRDPRLFCDFAAVNDTSLTDSPRLSYNADGVFLGLIQFCGGSKATNYRDSQLIAFSKAALYAPNAAQLHGAIYSGNYTIRCAGACALWCTQSHHSGPPHLDYCLFAPCQTRNAFPKSAALPEWEFMCNAVVPVIPQTLADARRRNPLAVMQRDVSAHCIVPAQDSAPCIWGPCKLTRAKRLHTRGTGWAERLHSQPARHTAPRDHDVARQRATRGCQRLQQGR